VAGKENWMKQNETGELSPAAIRPGKGGRPSRAEAMQLDKRLLDVAASLFMERGFEGTSIDAIAEVAGVSKPTVYARYRDKRDLFAAVLQDRIRRWLAPLSAAAEAAEVSPQRIDKTLHNLSRDVLAIALTRESIMLRRIVAAQAIQFPDLAQLSLEEGWLRAVRAVEVLLREFRARGEIKVKDPAIAADLFLNLVLGTSERLALYDIATDPKVQEQRRRAAVELFLAGVSVR
jgi:AcrR family transcriptional regulator